MVMPPTTLRFQTRPCGLDNWTASYEVVSRAKSAVYCYLTAGIVPTCWGDIKWEADKLGAASERAMHATTAHRQLEAVLCDHTKTGVMQLPGLAMARTAGAPVP